MGVDTPEDEEVSDLKCELSELSLAPSGIAPHSRTASCSGRGVAMKRELGLWTQISALPSHSGSSPTWSSGFYSST